MAFHLRFQSNGRFYVSSYFDGMNGLDEYQVVGSAPAFQRRILAYPGNGDRHVHTIDWLGFRPGGHDDELFVTTGDGGPLTYEAEFSPSLFCIACTGDDFLEHGHGRIFRIVPEPSSMVLLVLAAPVVAFLRRGRQ